MSEAVRERWDALLDCLSASADEPEQMQALPRTEYQHIYDRPAGRGPADVPDLQQTIARQLDLSRQSQRNAYQQPPAAADDDIPSTRRPNFGRLMTRGR
jgi:hypothetical protein